MGNDSPYYEIEGDFYDRVTKVLDYFPNPQLVAWKLKVGEKEAAKISKIALKVGSRVDELVKADLVQGFSKLFKKDGIEVQNCIEGWKNFRNEHPEVKFISVDRVVKSQRLLCAGTFDIETNDSIMDIKCSGKISPNYWLQVAMYNYMSGLNKPNLSILRLHKSLAIYEYHTIPYSTKLVRIFIGLLRAYRFYTQYNVEDADDTSDDQTTEEQEMDRPEISNDRAGGNW